MAKGRKTGGRLKGTPNKATAEVKLFVSRVQKRLWAKNLPGYRTLEDCAATLLTCGVPAVILRTWEVLMAYKYGKPVQPIAGAGEDSEPVKIVFDSIPRPRRREKEK